jgi:hypothetical protein
MITQAGKEIGLKSPKLLVWIAKEEVVEHMGVHITALTSHKGGLGVPKQSARSSLA